MYTDGRYDGIAHLLVVDLHELAVHAVVNQPSTHIISSSSGPVVGICGRLQHGEQLVGTARDHTTAAGGRSEARQALAAPQTLLQVLTRTQPRALLGGKRRWYGCEGR